jgi:hypothetical protein
MLDFVPLDAHIAVNPFIERVGQIAQIAAEKLHVPSALNPALWLCAIVTPLCLSSVRQPG